MTVKVSGIFTIRNAFEAGYPFVESILSILPAVDEMLVNDGGSDDGTLELLQKMENDFHKVELYQIDDFKSDNWDCIDHQLEHLISEAEGDWIFESQGDELYHEDDILDIRDLIEWAHEKDYNSIRQPRESVGSNNWSIGSYTYPTVRIVRNLPDLESYWGGDDFRIETDEERQYSAHHVPPEYESDIPFYHYNRAFEVGRMENYRRHAEWLATDHEGRKQAYQEASGTDTGAEGEGQV